MASKIIIGKSKIHGKGIFARQDIKKGEIVCIIKGPQMFKINRSMKDALSHPDWVGLKANNWVDPISPYKYLNHSCDPNTAIKGYKTLIAIENICKGAEITIDYSIIEGDYRWYMKCNCENKKCRKLIKSIGFLNPKLYQKYSPYISKEFRKIYEKNTINNK